MDSREGYQTARSGADSESEKQRVVACHDRPRLRIWHLEREREQLCTSLYQNMVSSLALISRFGVLKPNTRHFRILEAILAAILKALLDTILV